MADTTRNSTLYGSGVTQVINTGGPALYDLDGTKVIDASTIGQIRSAMRTPTVKQPRRFRTRDYVIAALIVLTTAFAVFGVRYGLHYVHSLPLLHHHAPSATPAPAQHSTVVHVAPKH